MSEINQGQIGEASEQLITRMRDEQGEYAVGNVLRRTCELGGEACKQVCQLSVDNPDEELQEAYEKNQRGCSDMNLKRAFLSNGLNPEDVLMVGVTANEVGFADKLDDYDVKENPSGWRELPGFNAFFARESEVPAIGRRLADCADINFELKDAGGNTVIGFGHGTRTNMFGSQEFPFDRNGEKVSFTEFALGGAVDHYGADPAGIKIKLAAAIKGHNFTKHFDDRRKMEEHLPGWFADGFVKNISNPDWEEGDEIIESDTWEADTRSLILRDIQAAMQRLGIPEENFSMDGIIDPGDSKGGHSSHQFRDEYGDTRDLYMTYVKSDKTGDQ